MNSFPFIKDFFSKLNKNKPNKFKLDLNKLFKEQSLLKTFSQKKYIISLLIILFAGGFSLLYFGNKQGKMNEINKKIQKIVFCNTFAIHLHYIYVLDDFW